MGAAGRRASGGSDGRGHAARARRGVPARDRGGHEIAGPEKTGLDTFVRAVLAANAEYRRVSTDVPSPFYGTCPGPSELRPDMNAFISQTSYRERPASRPSPGSNSWRTTTPWAAASGKTRQWALGAGPKTSSSDSGSSAAPDHTLEPALTLRPARPVSLLLATLLAAPALTGCTLMDLAQDCEGTDARVEELAALHILDSRPDEATAARGFEEVDAGCWSDSGDATVYAERTYAFPGTRADVAAYYRTAARQDGWIPAPDVAPDDLSFVKKTMNLRIVFLTAEVLAEEGHGSRPDLSTGAGYSINVDSYA